MIRNSIDELKAPTEQCLQAPESPAGEGEPIDQEDGSPATKKPDPDGFYRDWRAVQGSRSFVDSNHNPREEVAKDLLSDKGAGPG
jgi:hypothetical protein